MGSTWLTISVIWGVVALLLLMLAWRAAVVGNRRRHRTLMVFLTIGAWLFVLSYLLRYSNADTAPQVPRELIPWLAFHGTVALIPLFGATALVIARLREGRSVRKRHLNRHHRIYGRVFVLLWAFTHLGGIANYFLL